MVTLFVLALQTLQTLDTKPAAAAEQMTVKVIGHRFWWEYQYPDLKHHHGDRSRHPDGQGRQPRTVVGGCHPQFLDSAVERQDRRLPQSRQLHLDSSEYAGHLSTASAPNCAARRMPTCARSSIAKTPEEFDQWVKDQQAGPAQPTDALAQQGQQVLLGGRVHRLSHDRWHGRQGKVGPNLTHVASRTSIAGGMFTNTEGNLERWLTNPPAVKPGSVMPNLNLTKTEIDALTAYLQSLK